MFARHGGFALAPRARAAEKQNGDTGRRRMNQAEERLSKAMQDLAAQAPPSAPPGLGVKLRDAFRRHHLRRRQRRFMWAAALATVIIAVFVAREKLSIHPQQTPALMAQATPTP